MSRVTCLLVVLVASAASRPTAEAQDTPAETTAPTEPIAPTGPRIRGGADGGFGLVIRTAAGDPGVSMPVQGRLGVQLDDTVAVYALTSVQLVVFDLGGFSQLAFFDWFTGAAVDFTFAGFVQVGGALGLDFQFGDGFFRERAYPGVRLRLAFLAGRTHSPGRRKGLAIALEQHFAIVEADIPGSGVMSFTVLTAGFELY